MKTLDANTTKDDSLNLDANTTKDDSLNLVEIAVVTNLDVSNENEPNQKFISY